MTAAGYGRGRETGHRTSARAVRGGPVASLSPEGPSPPSTFAASTPAMRVRRVGLPGGTTGRTISGVPSQMKQTLRRAWGIALGVAPLAAMVLVEAATKRW